MPVLGIICILVFAICAVSLLGETLAELIGLLIVFLFKCVVLVIGLLLKLLFKVLVWSAKRLWRSIVLTGAFIAFVIMEQVTGSDADDEYAAADDDDDDEEEDKDAAYAAALSRLGLDANVTADALRRAYRAMMKQVHPDRPGGSTARAQAVNEAYELVRAYHGWN